MGLQNFIARRLPTIKAVWLNLIDNYVIGTGAKSPYERTTLETTQGVTPVNFAFQPGDVRRYVLDAAEQTRAWYCYGHTATFIDATHFSIPGNLTTTYRSGVRLQFLSSGGALTTLRVVSSAFAASKTTVTVTADMGQAMPNPITAVSIQTVLDAGGPSALVYDVNSVQSGLFVFNLNTGSTAVGRISASVLDPTTGTSQAHIVMVAVPPSYTGAYLTGGYASGQRSVIYSQVTSSLEIGTSDTARILIPNDGSEIRLQSNLNVENGNGTAATSQINMVAQNSNRVSLKNGATETGFLFASGTEADVGTNLAIDFAIIRNSVRCLTINASPTTGASTPTLSANKPGANAGVIEWISVKTSGGTQGWIPIFGN